MSKRVRVTGHPGYADFSGSVIYDNPSFNGVAVEYEFDGSFETTIVDRKNITPIEEGDE